MAGGAIDFLRDADWLDGRRVRGYAVIVGIASLGLLIVSWIGAMGPQGSDFLAFWGAGRAVLDEIREAQAAMAKGTS